MLRQIHLNNSNSLVNNSQVFFVVAFLCYYVVFLPGFVFVSPPASPSFVGVKNETIVWRIDLEHEVNSIYDMLQKMATESLTLSSLFFFFCCKTTESFDLCVLGYNWGERYSSRLTWTIEACLSCWMMHGTCGCCILTWILACCCQICDRWPAVPSYQLWTVEFYQQHAYLCGRWLQFATHSGCNLQTKKVIN